MNIDQATNLRRQQATRISGKQKNRQALRITVTSGKGGVGKSNFALNAAIALTALERKVLLVDADANLANLDLLIGINPKNNLSDVINGTKEIHDILITGPGGVTIMPGASGDMAMLNLDTAIERRLIESFDVLDSSFDVIIIDTGAGLSPQIISYATGADEVIVVTHPEPTATADAYAMIKVISHNNRNSRINLLVNMARNAEEAADLFDRLNLVVQNFLQFKIEYLGYLPVDQQVRQAVSIQQPFFLAYPKSPVSIAVQMIVRKLLRQAINTSGDKPPLWSRVTENSKDK